HVHRSGHADRAQHLLRIQDPSALEVGNLGRESARTYPMRSGRELWGLRREDASCDVALERRLGRALRHVASDESGGPAWNRPRRGSADHASSATVQAFALNWSNATSPRPLRTNCGTWTSPAVALSLGGSMPRSSSMRFPAAWSAGNCRSHYRRIAS